LFPFFIIHIPVVRIDSLRGRSRFRAVRFTQYTERASVAAFNHRLAFDFARHFVFVVRRKGV
jgi:hypothetical protein